MSSPNYRIYPSLLDKFQKYLDADKEFEGYWNVDGEGRYKRSFDEIADELEQSLLDAINRVDKGFILAADKGTCFNALVDNLACGSPLPEGMTSTLKLSPDGTAYYEMTYHDFTFCFHASLLEKVATYFDDSIPQHRCEATISTKYGDVLLYGYIDEIKGDGVFDIKTTSSYDFGKFSHGWQRYAYPYCLVESGEMPEVRTFEYTVFKWMERVGKPSEALMFREEYAYDHERAGVMLRGVCESLIEYIEKNAHRITDEKIFGR